MSSRRDRGAVSAQLVVLTPVLMLLLLVAVQFALAWHAQHIAQLAASQGLADARAADGDESAGSDAAQAAIDNTAGRVLRQARVHTSRTESAASVRVDGQVLPLIPGLNLTVSGYAEGPVERFTTPGGAP
ncbi:TadE/TadG family type IV pilus assembly protein [Streptomyces sp. NBRC 109706]|uniref:TadE/TadG family type IV pilus assembly protein n=1 Tax=Streptomyces sp. NBRC 109706 TaxID=1550035 RepID=UPI000781977F|nr:TadE/TadG family type IV pilus assembly protein [Streptomyces sp. NBRC 109706]